VKRKPDPNWIAGFVSSEGCFDAFVGLLRNMCSILSRISWGITSFRKVAKKIEVLFNCMINLIAVDVYDEVPTIK